MKGSMLCSRFFGVFRAHREEKELPTMVVPVYIASDETRNECVLAASALLPVPTFTLKETFPSYTGSGFDFWFFFYCFAFNQLLWFSWSIPLYNSSREHTIPKFLCITSLLDTLSQCVVWGGGC